MSGITRRASPENCERENTNKRQRKAPFRMTMSVISSRHLNCGKGKSRCVRIRVDRRRKDPPKKKKGTSDVTCCLSCVLCMSPSGWRRWRTTAGSCPSGGSLSRSPRRRGRGSAAAAGGTAHPTPGHKKKKQETRGDNTAVCMSTKINLRTFRRHNLFRGKMQQVGHSGP